MVIVHLNELSNGNETKGSKWYFIETPYRIRKELKID